MSAISWAFLSGNRRYEYLAFLSENGSGMGMKKGGDTNELMVF
jgi:hypothetical protein